MDNFPLFYKKMIFFNECKKINTLGCLNDALKEPLWSNDKVLFKNKPISIKAWL
jgi:hypothetical protein